MARPTKYSSELIDKLCHCIATSTHGLKKICDDNEDFPHFKTVFRWLGEEDKQELRDKYARSKELQMELFADEILEIADDSSEDVLRRKLVKNSDGSMMELAEENREFTNRSRLRVDSRKWLMSKLAPKKYGDKIDITTDGKELPTPIYGGHTEKDV